MSLHDDTATTHIRAIDDGGEDELSCRPGQVEAGDYSAVSEENLCEMENKSIDEIVKLTESLGAGSSTTGATESANTSDAPAPRSNGARKKVRPQALQSQLSAPEDDYLSVWSAREGPKTADAVAGETNCAPPKHRPLERSWPPRMRHKHIPSGTNASNEFIFDIIDTDEMSLGSNDSDDPQGASTNRCEANSGAAGPAPNDSFIPGEFFRGGDANKRKRNFYNGAPLATPETDGSMSISDRHADVESPLRLRPLMKKKIGPDNYISTISAQKIRPEEPALPLMENNCQGEVVATMEVGASASGNGSQTVASAAHKAHKPLSRQLSKKMTNYLDLQPPPASPPPANHEKGPDDLVAITAPDAVENRHYILCRKPPAEQPTPPQLPLNGDISMGESEFDLPGPAPRLQVHRVANVNGLVCPRRRPTMQGDGCEP